MREQGVLDKEEVRDTATPRRWVTCVTVTADTPRTARLVRCCGCGRVITVAEWLAGRHGKERAQPPPSRRHERRTSMGIRRCPSCGAAIEQPSGEKEPGTNVICVSVAERLRARLARLAATRLALGASGGQGRALVEAAWQAQMR